VRRGAHLPERSTQTVPPLAGSSFEILTVIVAPSALPLLGLASPTVHLVGKGTGGGWGRDAPQTVVKRTLS
jgi:hypothetical protein